MSEDESNLSLRNAALDYAIRNSTPSDFPRDVVKRAEAYLAFLRGSPTAPESPK
jgi:hypothetical protein